MKTNTINLNFKSLSDISGNPYGRKIYDEQIKNNIDLECINEICFPSNVESVSISFVQGLMGRFIEENLYDPGVENKKEFFKKYCKLVSDDNDLQENLMESIDF